MIKKLAYLLLICFCLGGCSRSNLTALTQNQNPIVTMTLDDEQVILIELYPDYAPNTVNNFISLIEEGYYDGLAFHRIVESYIIQGGDPLMNNYGTPGYTIKGEFKQNGFKNKLRHDKGVISMARGAKYDSAGSQFFITVDDANMLNGYYAAFGKVIQGMELVEQISNIDLESGEILPPIIQTVTVDAKMNRYPEPIVIPLDSQ